MRNLLKFIMPNSWISQRKIFGRKILFISKEHLNLFFLKPYEIKVWKEVEKKLKLDKSSKIIDIGANIGQAMLALNKIYPQNVIDSYEPQAKEFCFLQLNRLINKVPGESFNYALSSDKTNNLYLSIDNETGGRTSFVSYEKDESVSLVKSLTISSILNENIGLIKIDVEGFESKLFNKPLKQLRDVNLIIEVRNSTSEDIINYFINTHEIYHLEQQRVVKKGEKVDFCNLLLTPFQQS